VSLCVPYEETYSSRYLHICIETKIAETLKNYAVRKEMTAKGTIKEALVVIQFTKFVKTDLFWATALRQREHSRGQKIVGAGWVPD
jgi:hypothetical protein